MEPCQFPVVADKNTNHKSYTNGHVVDSERRP